MQISSQKKKEAKRSRKAEYPIDSIFLHRWSPRAMSGDSIHDKDLMALFEAAKWAPSSYNGQPWRFIYAKKGTKYWNNFFNLLVEFNQQWAINAAVLVVVISKKTFANNGKPSRTHSFDTGAAWQNLALQGSLKGLVVHGMEGFNYESARKVLMIPDDFDVEAMVAIGQPSSKEILPEKLQKMEVPSNRKPLKDISYEGSFPTIYR